jgi:hypothetical protein
LPIRDHNQILFGPKHNNVEQVPVVVVVVVVAVVTCIGGYAACLEDINPRQWGRTPPFFVRTWYLEYKTTAKLNNKKRVIVDAS